MQEKTQTSLFSGIQVKVLIWLAVVLVAVLTAAFIGGIHRSQEQGIAAASEKSAALAQQMDVLWDYLEVHQDVALANASTISDENGYICIISVKAVAERFSDASTTSIRYTSLAPRNTQDAPDEFEQAAMELFVQDPTVSAYEAVSPSPTGEGRYRYLQPLRVNESCLPCHGAPKGELDSLGYPKEGYELGDLVGAISITTPMDGYYQSSWNTVAHWLLLLLAGLLVAGIVVFTVLNRTVLHPVAAMSRAVHAYREGDISYRIDPPHGTDEVSNLARDVNAMADELQDLYSGLEQRVEARTEELQKLNTTLSDMLTNQQQNLDLAVERLREEREAMARRALEPIHVGVFEFDQAKFMVSKQGEEIALTPKEFNILFTLASRSGEVVSQSELVRIAWGEGYTEEMASLAVYIRRIRKKIEDDSANPKYLQTVWGEGYKFVSGE